jgi:hypothetical protein
MLGTPDKKGPTSLVRSVSKVYARLHAALWPSPRRAPGGGRINAYYARKRADVSSLLSGLEHRRGRDPLRPRVTRQFLSVDGGTGLGNYLRTVPILDLPGRNLTLRLDLCYNSNAWRIWATDQAYLVSTMIRAFPHRAGRSASGSCLLTWSPGSGFRLLTGRSTRCGYPSATVASAPLTEHSMVD